MADGLTLAVLEEMPHWSKWTTVFEPVMKTPPPYKEKQKFLGKYLQECPEGSFREVARGNLQRKLHCW